MKRGFTLIELLAVIIILAIIALITIPAVIGIINNSNEQANQRSVEFYIDAVEKTLANKNLEDEFDPESCTVSSNSIIICDGEQLKVSIEDNKIESGRLSIVNGIVKGYSLYIGKKEYTNMYKLVINYVYSNKDLGEASLTYEGTFGIDEKFEIQSPDVKYYKPDNTKIKGSMKKGGKEYTVTYKPINDKNENLIADEVDPEEIYTPRRCFGVKETKAGIEIVKYTCGDTGTKEFYDVIIPSTFNNKNVVSISNSAFEAQKITSIKLPNTITSIGSKAFLNNYLTSITLPSNLKIINSYILKDNKLTNIEIPSSVTSMGIYAFSNNLLKSVTIPGNIKKISNYSFYNNKIETLKIENGVTSIGRGSFQNNQLTSLEIASSVTSIEKESFNNNKLPDDLAFIYKRNSDGSIDNKTIVSYGGAKRSNITLPSNVTTIGQYAFSRNSITSITLPNTITSIGEGAFNQNSLTSITIPSSLTTISSSLFIHNQLSSITIPSSVTTIGQYAFYSNKLTSVEIPSSVKTIDKEAFLKNKLTSVVIKGKSSKSDFTSFGTNVFGWATGYSDSNIVFEN